MKLFRPQIKAARLQSKNGPRFPVGLCLQRVRLCFGIGPRALDAVGAWSAAAGKHPVASDALIPRGVPVFWSGGSEGHGHIAIATGFNGMCWSPDTKRPGYFDKVRIDDVTDWVSGGRFLGWTEDLNGVTVYKPRRRK